MQASITAGCTTDHGGIIIENDPTFIVDGRGVHLEGMTHWCPKCKVVVSAISSGKGFFIVGGKSVIVHGDISTCGARYLKQSDLLVMNSGIPKTIPLLPLIDTAKSNQSESTMSFSGKSQEKKKEPYNPNPYKSDPDASKGALSSMTFGLSEKVGILKPDDPNGGAYAAGALAGAVVGPNKAKIASAAAKAKAAVKAGRTGKLAKMKSLMTDDKLGKADKGWLKQEYNRMIAKGKSYMRNPPGKELAHERGREAAKGFDYKHSNLQDKMLHKIQHMFDDFGRKNKPRP